MCKKFAGSIVALLLAGGTALAAPSAQWVNGVTIISVSDVDYGGEVVQITLSSAQNQVAGCPGSPINSFALRDANTMKGGLAIALAAFTTGHKVNLFVIGVCDSTGLPQINSITIS